MTAVRIPSLEVLSKAIEDDPDGGSELLRLTLFETLADLTEFYAPGLEADFAKGLEDSAALTRRQIVREYVSKRLAGEPVDDLLAAAGVLGTVSKGPESREQRQKAAAKEPRDTSGRWARQALAGLDKIDTFVSDTQGTRDTARAKEGNGRGYAQLSAAGDALAAASIMGGNMHGAALGATMRLAGELGPEAENVLGPSLRRTAYRYRGTERRPAAAQMTTTHDMVEIAAALQSGKDLNTVLSPELQRKAVGWTAQANERNERRADAAAPRVEAPAGVLSYWRARADEVSQDQLRMGVSGDYMSTQLVRYIPSLHHAQISLAAGKMPPSVGVIIDADGDVVSQAQGFNGDHYLPFDLRNLKRLHGGSYVRTRTTGGPTDEDIYTGLMTGARQLQVISHSGVFTVEFEPDIRGGRRYSDKARQMVGRYAALVAEIGSGRQMQTPFTAAQRKEWRDAAIAYGGDNYDLVQSKYNDLQSRARAGLRFAGATATAGQVSDRAVAEQRAAIAQGVPTSRQSEARDYDELATLTEAQAAKVYRLDGDGYRTALNALKAEFPFYIRNVDYQTWPEFTESRRIAPYKANVGATSADIGYTEHRATEPKRIAARLKEREQRPATKAVEGGAGAREDAAPAAAVPTELETALARSLRTAMPVVHGYGEGEVPPNAVESEAVAEGAGNYSKWLAEQYHDRPEQLAKWLSTEASETSISTLREGLLDTQRTLEGHPDTERAQIKLKNSQIERAAEALADLQILRFPFAEPNNAPVTTESVEPKPQYFADIAALGDADVRNYSRYLGEHEQVADAYAGIEGHSDEQIAEVVQKQVGEYNRLYRLGKEMAEDPDRAAANMGPEFRSAVGDVGEAREIYSDPNNLRYRDLEALQKAWAFKRGLRALSIKQGREVSVGGAGPKVEPVPGPVLKRRSIPVYQPGSPVSKALSARARRPQAIH